MSGTTMRKTADRWLEYEKMSMVSIGCNCQLALTIINSASVASVESPMHKHQSAAGQIAPSNVLRLKRSDGVLN